MNDDLLCTIYWPMPDHPRGEQEVLVRIPLRPLLAGLAMDGLLSNPSLKLARDGEDVSVNRDAIAEIAWLMADAMLKRLEKKPEAGEVAE